MRWQTYRPLPPQQGFTLAWTCSQQQHPLPQGTVLWHAPRLGSWVSPSQVRLIQLPRWHPRWQRRSLDLDFVEMSEVTMDTSPEPAMGRPGRPPVTSISQWTEKFAAMAALLSTRFPLKASELFAYLAAVVRADYDLQFRREALARRSLDWSVPDSRLYSEAFTGRAKSIPRCAVCLLDDHLTQDCPQNPDRPWWGWLPSGSTWSGPPVSSSPAGPHHPRRSLEVCRHYNEGRCRLPACRYLHTCTECRGDHPAIQCGRVRRPPQAWGNSGWPRR